jgi:hypothetical protein
VGLASTLRQELLTDNWMHKQALVEAIRQLQSLTSSWAWQTFLNQGRERARETHTRCTICTEVSQEMEEESRRANTIAKTKNFLLESDIHQA